MESNHQCPPMPNNPNREGVSNTEEANLTLEEVTTEDAYKPNNQLLTTYHRSGPDGKYVPVGLSLGFRFDPDDDELIQYLNKKISTEGEATCIFIPTVNIYRHSPEELADMHQSVGREEWYFFSTRDRKYLNGTRPNRAAGNGYWKATAVDKKIYDHIGKHIGSRKYLVFYQGKAPKGKKTNWAMQEYVAHLPERQLRGTGDMRLDDYVLCRIYKTSNRSPHGEKQTVASEPDDKNQARPSMQLAVPQPNPPTPLQNLDQGLHLNPTTAPQQNPQVPQQNLHAIEYNTQAAGSHNQGGQSDYPFESIPELTRDEIQLDNPENSHELFSDLISMDMDENLTFSSVFQDWFGQFSTSPGANYNYFDINPYPSLMNCFNPNPPPFDNDDISSSRWPSI